MIQCDIIAVSTDLSQRGRRFSGADGFNNVPLVESLAVTQNTASAENVYYFGANVNELPRICEHLDTCVNIFVMLYFHDII